MTTQELKKQNREKWMMSHGITTTDYMDELIDLVWKEGYKKGYIDGNLAEIEAEPFYTKDNNGVIHFTKQV